MDVFCTALREDISDVALWRIYHDWLIEHESSVEKVVSILSLLTENKGKECIVSRFLTETRDESVLYFSSRFSIWVGVLMSSPRSIHREGFGIQGYKYTLEEWGSIIIDGETQRRIVL